ncbi:hypothetical protein [Beijerinckia sp. L45]|uniref:hypothetical protein n=1 Tax=Beijerinckia sp. L45 TaxID=1641855 RepID=UPI00131E7BB3|nr:hypothetical protein [Beijerinckia sp. L45]
MLFKPSLLIHRNRAPRQTFMILAVLIIAGATLYFDWHRSTMLVGGAENMVGEIASP